MNLPSLIKSASKSFSQCYLRRIEPTGQYRHQLHQISSATTLLRTEEPAASGLKNIATVNREEASDPNLFHRQVNVRLRLGNKRAVRDIRRGGTWIPIHFQGCGKLPDMLLQMEVKPLQDDLNSGLFALQRRGKIKLTGPLYEMRMISGGVDDYGNELPIDVPFDRIRVLPQNMEIHYVKATPMSLVLKYAPENEPVRVRIPLRLINEGKAPGLKEKGWINRLHRYIDINVAPYTKAPLYGTVDLAGLNMKGRKLASDVMFEGKNNGCRIVIAEDTPVVMISKI